jgi:GT2 family glycosyltransferase
LITELPRNNSKLVLESWKKARENVTEERAQNLDTVVDLSVIILNWNTRTLLQECLQTLTQPQSGIHVQIIVADNASEDGSREMVLALFPGVILHVNSTNVGFGAGNNAALPLATGRYVLFLNSDTKVVENALPTLVQYADANPDIGILGPKLLNADGSLQYSCRRYPRLATGFFRNTPLGRLFPKNRFASDYLMQDWDHATPRDVDWVSGAALFIRRALLDKIGGFDEEFYMYCEDVDLCWRANHASSRVTYLPDAVVYHYIGKSSDMVPTRMTYEFHRSQYLFYKKHYAAHTSLLLRPIILPGIMLRALGQILRYRARHLQRKVLAWRMRHARPEAAAAQVNQTASQTGAGRPGDAS